MEDFGVGMISLAILLKIPGIGLSIILLMLGISRRGAANPNAKLSKDQRKEILFRYKANERICDLANEFKVSRLTIRRIINPKLRSFNRLK